MVQDFLHQYEYIYRSNEGVDFYGKLVGKYTGLVPWMLWDWMDLFNHIIQQPNWFTVSNLSCVPSEESGFMSFHQLEYPQKTSQLLL